MNWDALGALSEAFGAVGVVVSLIYVAVQLRQNTRQNRLNAQRDLVHEFGVLAQSATTDESLARILWDGSFNPESLSDVERVRFNGYLNHLFKLFEQQHLLHQEGADDHEMWEAVQAMMDDFLTNPGCQDWWGRRSHYHTRRFQAHVNARKAELERTGREDG